MEEPVSLMVRLVKWFAALLGIFALSRLFAYLWTESILKFLIVMSAVGFLLGWVVLEQIPRNETWFRVRYVSPNILRADPDDFAIEYHEGEKSLMLYGKLLERSKRLVTIPATQEWETRIPTEWAKGRREEIRGRIKADLNPKVYEIGDRQNSWSQKLALGPRDLPFYRQSCN